MSANRKIKLWVTDEMVHHFKLCRFVPQHHQPAIRVNLTKRELYDFHDRGLVCVCAQVHMNKTFKVSNDQTNNNSHQ